MEMWATTQAMMTRYKDGYRFAKFIIVIGYITGCVAVGVAILIAGIAFFGSVTTYATMQKLSGTEAAASAAWGVLISGFLGACLIGAIFFIIAIIVRAQGQMVQATLDTAINSSPFLTDEQRAEVMSLPIPTSLISSPAMTSTSVQNDTQKPMAADPSSIAQQQRSNARMRSSAVQNRYNGKPFFLLIKCKNAVMLVYVCSVLEILVF